MRTKFQRYTIEDFDQIAKARKGVCLSISYYGPKRKLRFRCENGHEWEAFPYSIAHGTWCPRCKKTGTFLQPAKTRFEQYVAKRGGRLLEAYKSTATPCLIECDKGHQWAARPGTMMNRDLWCRKCQAASRDGARRKNDRAFCAIIKKCGGEIIECKDGWENQQVTVKCSDGHVCQTLKRKVLMSEQWCSICKKASPEDPKNAAHLEKLQTIAKKNGGNLVDEKYKGMRARYDWVCSKNHQWSATGSAVSNGSWCPVCAPRGRHKIGQISMIMNVQDTGCCSPAMGG
ncbi:MAG: hypothetical protein CSYNP_02842 [Syntrophus sp. SKADARSKE-3]|nr:hypothetical protein [Syntrophus sp. SKADARSKE-3]